MAPSSACSASILCGAARYVGVGSDGSLRAVASCKAMDFLSSARLQPCSVPPGAEHAPFDHACSQNGEPDTHVAATCDLERDDFSSNRHPALGYCWSMIFSENRYPLFGIML